MLKKQPADDLFEKSSMSFGEHLEELRRSLTKAFIWLGIGTLLGLYVADKLVLFIQTPLEAAIYNFHIEQAKFLYEQANGEAPPEELSAFMLDNGHLPEVVYVDPNTFSQPDGGLPDIDLPGSDEGETATQEVESPPEEQTNDPSTEQSTSETVAKSASNSKEHPWKGVDLAKLKSLRPFLLWRPINTKLVTLTPIEGFMIWLKAGLVAGVVIGSPGIFWHIWQFFAAGLYPHERRYVYWYLPLSLLLFLSGVGLAFFVVLRLVLGFLMTYTVGMNVEFTPRLNDYMSFALFLPLGFGIAFQLPILMLGLHRFGVLTVETFISQWRVAVLGIAFLSMLLTPADVYSMIGLFVPMTLLYFFGIALCIYMPKGAGIGSAALDPQ